MLPVPYDVDNIHRFNKSPPLRLLDMHSLGMPGISSRIHLWRQVYIDKDELFMWTNAGPTVLLSIGYRTNETGKFLTENRPFGVAISLS